MSKNEILDSIGIIEKAYSTRKVHDYGELWYDVEIPTYVSLKISNHLFAVYSESYISKKSDFV